MAEEVEEESGFSPAELVGAQERLNEIWTDLGVQLGTAESTAHVKSLASVIEWLQGAEEHPVRAVRATQCLLCDPQRPAAHKRPLWTPLKKALIGALGNPGVTSSDVQLLQALLRAAWPLVSGDFLRIAGCLVSSAPLTPSIGGDAASWAWRDDETDEDAAIGDEEALPAVSEHRSERLLDFMWWGQARYSRALRRPYRRLSSSEVSFWVPWEGAEASVAEADLEAGAAYIAETVSALGHDLDEKKTLADWMSDFSAVLNSAGDRVRALGVPLRAIATEDALALPVSWLRIQPPGVNWTVTDAAEATALDLGRVIDRGEWVQWVFRELTLERRLAASAA